MALSRRSQTEDALQYTHGFPTRSKPGGQYQRSRPAAVVKRGSRVPCPQLARYRCESVSRESQQSRDKAASAGWPLSLQVYEQLAAELSVPGSSSSICNCSNKSAGYTI